VSLPHFDDQEINVHCILTRMANARPHLYADASRRVLILDVL
jgi:hypothetical protein